MHPQSKDKFYDLFLKDPNKDNFRLFLKDTCGELDEVDFKKECISFGHLAKTMLAMANSHGGVIVIGIEENDDKTIIPQGISEFKDKADVNNKISKYIPPELDYEIFDYNYDSSEYEAVNGKKFQIIVIHDTPDRLPFISRNELPKEIQKDTIYIRRGTKCEKATANDIDRLLQRRLTTIYKTTSDLSLEEHLAQLKILYNELPKKISVLVKRGNSSIFSSANALKEFFCTLSSIVGEPDEYAEQDNPFYPEESYEEFISRLIQQKKIRIERFLGIK